MWAVLHLHVVDQTVLLSRVDNLPGLEKWLDLCRWRILGENVSEAGEVWNHSLECDRGCVGRSHCKLYNKDRCLEYKRCLATINVDRDRTDLVLGVRMAE